jgi:hypothetical protein
MKGIPKVEGISFGNVDDSPFAPLHRRLGIETYTHMQAVLFHPFDGHKAPPRWLLRHPVFSHWYRVPVTLAKVMHER